MSLAHNTVNVQVHWELELSWKLKSKLSLQSNSSALVDSSDRVLGLVVVVNCANAEFEYVTSSLSHSELLAIAKNLLAISEPLDNWLWITSDSSDEGGVVTWSSLKIMQVFHNSWSNGSDCSLRQDWSVWLRWLGQTSWALTNDVEVVLVALNESADGEASLSESVWSLWAALDPVASSVVTLVHVPVSASATVVLLRSLPAEHATGIGHTSNLKISWWIRDKKLALDENSLLKLSWLRSTHSVDSANSEVVSLVLDELIDSVLHLKSAASNDRPSWLWLVLLEVLDNWLFLDDVVGDLTSAIVGWLLELDGASLWSDLDKLYVLWSRWNVVDLNVDLEGLGTELVLESALVDTGVLPGSVSHKQVSVSISAFDLHSLGVLGLDWSRLKSPLDLWLWSSSEWNLDSQVLAAVDSHIASEDLGLVESWRTVDLDIGVVLASATVVGGNDGVSAFILWLKIAKNHSMNLTVTVELVLSSTDKLLSVSVPLDLWQWSSSNLAGKVNTSAFLANNSTELATLNDEWSLTKSLLGRYDIGKLLWSRETDAVSSIDSDFVVGAFVKTTNGSDLVDDQIIGIVQPCGVTHDPVLKLVTNDVLSTVLFWLSPDNSESISSSVMELKISWWVWNLKWILDLSNLALWAWLGFSNVVDSNDSEAVLTTNDKTSDLHSALWNMDLVNWYPVVAVLFLSLNEVSKDSRSTIVVWSRPANLNKVLVDFVDLDNVWWHWWEQWILWNDTVLHLDWLRAAEGVLAENSEEVLVAFLESLGVAAETLDLSVDSQPSVMAGFSSLKDVALNWATAIVEASLPRHLAAVLVDFSNLDWALWSVWLANDFNSNAHLVRAVRVLQENLVLTAVASIDISDDQIGAITRVGNHGSHLNVLHVLLRPEDLWSWSGLEGNRESENTLGSTSDDGHGFAIFSSEHVSVEDHWWSLLVDALQCLGVSVLVVESAELTVSTGIHGADSEVEVLIWKSLESVLVDSDWNVVGGLPHAVLGSYLDEVTKQLAGSLVLWCKPLQGHGASSSVGHLEASWSLWWGDWSLCKN